MNTEEIDKKLKDIEAETEFCEKINQAEIERRKKISILCENNRVEKPKRKLFGYYCPNCNSKLYKHAKQSIYNHRNICWTVTTLLSCKKCRYEWATYIFQLGFQPAR